MIFDKHTVIILPKIQLWGQKIECLPQYLTGLLQVFHLQENVSILKLADYWLFYHWSLIIAYWWLVADDWSLKITSRGKLPPLAADPPQLSKIWRRQDRISVNLPMKISLSLLLGVLLCPAKYFATSLVLTWDNIWMCETSCFLGGAGLTWLKPSTWYLSLILDSVYWSTCGTTESTTIKQ